METDTEKKGAARGDKTLTGECLKRKNPGLQLGSRNALKLNDSQL